MDPWLLDWGDLGGVRRPQKIHNVSFGLQVGHKQSQEPKKEGASGADKEKNHSAALLLSRTLRAAGGDPSGHP